MNASPVSTASTDGPNGGAPPPRPILRVNNLEVIYNHVVLVLKGLSLEIAEGAIVALLGSNGAGKSTVLKAISGFLPLEDGEITEGEIEFAGHSLRHRPPHRIVADGVFQVMEGRRIFEHLTVEENLRCGAITQRDRSRRVRDQERCFEYFPQLRDRRRQNAGYLSGGEQQMLAISRALLARPRLILLDEPSLGLAPRLVEEIFGILRDINRREGISILLVEQNAPMALSVSSYGYILENGRIVLDGPVDRLRDDHDVQEFYLGLGQVGTSSSYRDVKHYKRRKRWLS